MTSDVFIQRLARAICEIFDDEADLHLFQDWLRLYQINTQTPSPQGETDA